MTRRSKKDLILAAALDVIGEEGMETLTFEAVAARAGMTRAGVVYHFATREALVDGIGEFLLASWHADLVRFLPVPVEEATTAQRVTALVRSSIEGTIAPGEWAFLIGSGAVGARTDRAWERVRQEWVGDREALTAGQQIALLAADGYWLNVASGEPGRNPHDPGVTRQLLRMAAGQ
nr:TetR/AcrR family transcriptional regulator [Actinomyces sp.]